MNRQHYLFFYSQQFSSPFPYTFVSHAVHIVPILLGFFFNTGLDRLRRATLDGETLTYPTLVHFKNSCNSTARIDAHSEETYVRDIVRQDEYSKKIHVRPDDR